MDNLIIYGAGGFGREAAWLVDRINKVKPTWNLLGYIDDTEEKQGTYINGYPVLGKADRIADFPEAYFVCSLGCSKDRENIINRIKSVNPSQKFAVLIDPSVEMSDYVEIGEGSIICAHTILTVNISIGCHVIINLDCTVGHDAVIGDFVTLSPSVNVSGRTIIGRSTEIGTGANLIDTIHVVDNTIIGAGTVVVKSIETGGTYVGSPAKKIK